LLKTSASAKSQVIEGLETLALEKLPKKIDKNQQATTSIKKYKIFKFLNIITNNIK
jgi:hypothetical protein